MKDLTFQLITSKLYFATATARSAILLKSPIVTCEYVFTKKLFKSNAEALKFVYFQSDTINTISLKLQFEKRIMKTRPGKAFSKKSMFW